MLKRMMDGLSASLFLMVMMSGCSVMTTLTPEATQVRIYDGLPEELRCTYLDEIVGSEANMLTFLFVSNRDITIGARNDLRNQAAKMGGNMVVVQRSIFVYTTSTTFVGQVYDCRSE